MTVELPVGPNQLTSAPSRPGAPLQLRLIFNLRTSTRSSTPSRGLTAPPPSGCAEGVAWSKTLRIHTLRVTGLTNGEVQKHAAW